MNHPITQPRVGAPGALVAPARPHGLVLYTLLAYGITWAITIAAFVTISAGLWDGKGAVGWWVNQIGAMGPLIAGVAVLAATRGRSGLAELARSIVRWRVHPGWYLFVLIGVPGLMTTVFTALHGPTLLPALAEAWPSLIAQLPILIVSIAIFTGLAEEPGWRGYAQPVANARYRPIVAALAVSVIWSLWHLPNALFAFNGLGELGAHTLATIVNGLILAWVYNSTGSVFVAMLLHGANNATATMLASVLGESTPTFSLTEYYLVSTVVFGALSLLVLVVTRGRLGMRSPMR